MDAKNAKQTGGDREALIEAAIAHMREQLEAHLPGDRATFAEIEAAAGRIGQSAQADLTHRLQGRPQQEAASEPSA